jgi:hypothetical protein
MTEKDLIELGFLRDEGEWTGSSDDKWYYYTLDIGDTWDKFGFISNSSDEAENGEWVVYIFDSELFKFKEFNFASSPSNFSCKKSQFDDKALKFSPKLSNA